MLMRPRSFGKSKGFVASAAPTGDYCSIIGAPFAYSKDPPVLLIFKSATICHLSYEFSLVSY